MTQRLRLVGYIRVSTAAQVDAFGPDVQRSAIQAWAKANGHKIVHWCQEAISGTTAAEDRPGLMCAVDELHQGRADGVVLYTLDRLARALHVQEAALGLLWRAGGQVFTVDAGEVREDDPEDPTRTLIRQVLGAVAQFERQTIVNRMKRGRHAKTSKGGYGGGAPAFGARSAGGHLVVDEDEAATVGRIMELHAAGESLRSIASTLAAEGRTAKRGGAWQPTTIARVIRRQGEVLAGHGPSAAAPSGPAN